MALLPIHSANYSHIRKRSYRKACRQAQRDEGSASYRGKPLTLRQIASQGHCPPTAATSPHPSVRSESRGGRQFRPLRVLSWNPGHLGAQQWSEIKDWLQAEAQSVCDVLCSKKLIGPLRRNSRLAGGPAFPPPPRSPQHQN